MCDTFLIKKVLPSQNRSSLSTAVRLLHAFASVCKCKPGDKHLRINDIDEAEAEAESSIISTVRDLGKDSGGDAISAI